MRTQIKLVLLSFIASFSCLTVKAGIPEGKDLFYNRKGSYGSCATCHPGGGSAGKWDAVSKKITTDKGKKITSVKGISDRRTIAQTKRLASYYAKEFEIQLTDAELQDVVMWLYMVNK